MGLNGVNERFRFTEAARVGDGVFVEFDTVLARRHIDFDRNLKLCVVDLSNFLDDREVEETVWTIIAVANIV